MMESARGPGPISFAVLVVFAALAAPGAAQVTLDVEIGWDRQQRSGAWTPLFLTVSDTGPRALRVAVSVPHGAGMGMRVETTITASSEPAVYPLYVPMNMSNDEMLIVVRDAHTGQRLVEWRSWEHRQNLTQNYSVETLIGTSGARASMRSLTTAAAQAQAVFIDPLRLPTNPIGYDSLSALVLNQPDLTRMPLEQQQAIIDWVRAGGKLIFWPSADPLPPGSPIVAALPVTIGQNTAVQIDPALLEKAGLPQRFATMKSREMSPRSGDVTTTPLFGSGGPLAFRRDLGLGRILVLPVDPTFFIFNTPQSAGNFWRPLLNGIIDLPEQAGTAAPAQYWNDPYVQRRASAYSMIADRLGDVPGIGRFGFTYVAAVLIGLMFVVGPVDWFVLKLLGRQPWTWFTTTGWIVLVTTGAIFVGHIFRSGDLHFRSLRVVDQVDGATIATTDLACIYSPRTAPYVLQTEREGWWQPGAAQNWGGRQTRMEIPFEQDARGNRPAPMIINVWTLRFLEGNTIAEGPPMIDSALSLRQTPDGFRYTGWIRNVSPRPLTNIVICSRPRTAGLVGGLAGLLDQTQVSYSAGPRRIEPGQTVEVDVPVAEYRVPRSTYYSADLLWLQAHDLASERARHVERRIASSDAHACIYAEVDQPAPATTLVAGAQPIEKHWQVVRALVRVAPAAEEQPR